MPKNALPSRPLLFALLYHAGLVAAQGNPYQLRLTDDAEYRLVDETQSNVRLADQPYAKEVAQAARLNRLDPALVHAVIHVESRHRADTRSPRGAIGLMQVLPATAARFGIQDARPVESNLNAGTRYLRSLLDLFDQRLDLALAAYNAGESAVLRHNHSIPPYPETQDYVPSVLKKYAEWRNDKNRRFAYQPGSWLDTRSLVTGQTATSVAPSPRPE